MFTYNAISGEKENGTLKAIISNQIPRYTIIVGKIIGGFISIIIPLMIPLLLAFIILTFNPRLSLNGEDWLRSAMILQSIILYVGIFCSLGLFVSSLSRNSALSLFILILAWVSFVYIIPQGAVMLSERIYPVKTVFEINAEKREAMRKINAMLRKTLDVWSEEHKNISDDEFKKHHQAEMQKSSQLMSMEIDAIDRKHKINLKKQQDTIRVIARFSPASLFHFCVMTLAGTGIEEHDNFQKYLAEYQTAFEKWVIYKMQDEIIFVPGQDITRPDYNTMPEFKYVDESLGTSFSRVLPDFVSMFFMILLLFAGALKMINTYDVR